MAEESCKIRIRFEPSDVPHTKKAVNYLSLSFALLVLRFFLEKTGLRIWWSCSHSEWDASIWRLLRRSPYPSLHLSQCYWHPRKQLASTSHICSHSWWIWGKVWVFWSVFRAVRKILWMDRNFYLFCHGKIFTKRCLWSIRIPLGGS